MVQPQDHGTGWGIFLQLAPRLGPLISCLSQEAPSRGEGLFPTCGLFATVTTLADLPTPYGICFVSTDLTPLDKLSFILPAFPAGEFESRDFGPILFPVAPRDPELTHGRCSMDAC